MTNQITKTLSPEESARFFGLIKIVETNLAGFYAVGKALAEIRESRLYREEFATWEDFCRQRFEITKTHANRLIEAAEIEMTPMGVKITSERQARELMKVPTEKRQEVMGAVSSSGKVVTANAIKNAAKQILRPPEPIELDLVGKAIPKVLLESWHRCSEIAKAGHHATSLLRSTIRAASESDDPAYREVDLSAMLSSLGGIYTGFSRVKPHAVCHACQGLRSGKCAACKGRGFVSKDFWDYCVPVEFKGAA